MRRPAAPITVPPQLPPEWLDLVIARGEKNLISEGRQNGIPVTIPGLDEFRAALGAASGTRPRTMPVRAHRAELSTREAAKVMQVSDRRVRRLAQKETIRARKKGRDWLIDAEAAADYHRRRT